MRILFIRHGDPDYVNDTLTEKGIREAKLIADRISRLEVSDFYCSTLGRARATAQVTLDRVGKTAVYYEWLREFPGYILEEETKTRHIPWDFMPGSWTKQPQLYDKDQWVKAPVMLTGNVEEVYQNIAANMDLLLERYGYIREGNYYRCEKSSPDTIVIFCHLGVQFAILSHLLGISPALLWQGFFVPPTSVTTLASEERIKGEVYFRCQALGDTSHLYAGNEPLSYCGFFQETFD